MSSFEKDATGAANEPASGTPANPGPGSTETTVTPANPTPGGGDSTEGGSLDLILEDV